MNGKVDKYDVFHKQMYKNMKDFPIFIYRIIILKVLKRKLLNLSKKGLSDPNTVLEYRDVEARYDKEMAKFTIEAANILKTKANNVYEISKDIKSIDTATFKAFLTANDIALNSFIYRLNEKELDALYYIAFYAILEKNGIDFNEQTADQLLELISLITKKYNRINTASSDFDLLSKILSPKFTLASLTEEEKAFIDNYHENYMREEILPYITTDEVSQSTILKKASKIYYKK